MIKNPEELKLQGFRSFETLDSKLSHGTSLKFADVRRHLRKVSKGLLLVLNIHDFQLFIKIYKKDLLCSEFSGKIN